MSKYPLTSHRSDFNCESAGVARAVCQCLNGLRPPLSETLFPVCRVGKIKASREVGNFFFFFPNFIFYKQECAGGGGSKKKYIYFENVGWGGEEGPSRPFLAHLGGGQETLFLFEDGLRLLVVLHERAQIVLHNLYRQ